MRPNRYYILGLAALLLSCGDKMLADETEAARSITDLVSQEDAADVEAPPIDSESPSDAADLIEPYSSDSGDWLDNPYLMTEPVAEHSILGARFGWWDITRSGSKIKVGEWQGLDSSAPFFDVDGLFTNGARTIDFHATGVESESTSAGLHYYGPAGVTADVEFGRYIHRLEHDRLLKPDGGFFDPALPTSSPGYVMWGEDLEPGEDYAIRVQKLEAKFKGHLTDNVRWKLNVWGMKKSGERQANTITHCWDDTSPGGNRRRCHMVNRGQNIDWLTMEVEPVIEARFDWLTAEYSRTMRSFQQSDEVMVNQYIGNSHATFDEPDGYYAQVPENYTEIDRIKLSTRPTDYTDVYLLGYVGNTHNKFRDMHRHFGGIDARFTDRSLEGLSLTAYGKTYVEDTNRAPFSLDDVYGHANYFEDAGIYADTSDQVDRDKNRLGVKTRWLPFSGDIDPVRRGLSVVSGYEFYQINRDDAAAEILLSTGTVTFTQPDTNSHRFYTGLEEKWSPGLTSYVRYTWVDVDYPLYGVRPSQTTSLDDALNSNLPTHEDRVEIGGTWMPTDNLMVNGQFWIKNSVSDADYVRFEEDSYPFVLTAWYAPTCRLNLSGGYSRMTNWIDQDITLGSNNEASRSNLDERSLPFTDAFRYMGKSDVINLGSTYAWSDSLTLTGGFEYVWAANLFNQIPDQTNTYNTAAPGDPPVIVTDTASYGDLPGYSEVKVQTYRLNAGFDYLWTPYVSTYFRYNYYNYGDIAMSYYSGEAHMFLAGVAGTF